MKFEDVILAWQFPASVKGEKKSELITGRRVPHQTTGGQLIFLHFKCKNPQQARLCKKWRVEQGFVNDESVNVILRPAHPTAAANANAFEVKGGKAYPILLKFQNRSDQRAPSVQMHL